MIKVTKMNDVEVVINSELIEIVEAVPDTMITMTTGRKERVRETVEEVVEKSIRYKQEIYKNLYKNTDV